MAQRAVEIVLTAVSSFEWMGGLVSGLRLSDSRRLHLFSRLKIGYGTRSTIMTSQLPTTKWHDYLGDPTMADAICDRLLHNAHRLALKGPSRRKEDSATDK